MPPRPSGVPALTDLTSAVLTALRTPVAVLAADLTVVWANPAFDGLLDQDADSLVGAPLTRAEEEPGRELSLQVRLGRSLATDQGAGSHQLRGRDGAGVERVVVVNVLPLPHGNEAGLRLVSLEDVTEQDLLEREARTYERELERSNRELEDFAHAASHDLQEPLRKIRTYAERLPALLGPGELDERAERYLVRLREAAERMQERTDALLQLARIGRQRPVPEPIQLNDVLKYVLLDLSLTIRETGASVEVEDLPELEADPVQMRVLFQNLISNALKFTRAGQRPVVRIAALPGHEASESTADPAAPAPRTIVVEDEGIGFEQQYAERIFSPFQRLHGRADYGGSGVGLALCRRVVEHHHGSIRAESVPDGGTRFFITLPREQPEEPWS